MSLEKKFLKYPQRQYGMDHNLYDWSMLSNRPKVSWPQGKKLAFWINVCPVSYTHLTLPTKA